MAKILSLKLLNAIGVILCFASPSWAEVRMITTTGEYRMGDHDTRADAKRIALQDAKRLALEKAGTYLESITEIKNFQLGRDEIRAYTAGVVEVTEQQTRSTMEGETTVVRVDMICRIDSDVVTRQIDALRKNETVKAELLQARQETDRLRKELDAKTRELSAVTSKTETETIAQARRKVLTGQDVNSLLTQAWVALGGSGGSLTASSSSIEGRRRARGLIEQALALDTSNSDVHERMGVLLAEEGNLEGAIAEFRTAIRLKPDDARAHNNLGIVLKAKGDLEGAITAYRTAIGLKPDEALAYNNLGNALTAKGDLEGAIAAFRTAIRLQPDDADVHYNLGVALYDKGDLEGAITAYRTAIRLQPDHAGAHYALGIALKDKGRRVEATREFREYLRLTPTTPENRLHKEHVRVLLRELE